MGLLLFDLQWSKKKLVALLLEIEATCPLNCFYYQYHLKEIYLTETFSHLVYAFRMSENNLEIKDLQESTF